MKKERLINSSFATLVLYSLPADFFLRHPLLCENVILLRIKLYDILEYLAFWTHSPTHTR